MNLGRISITLFAIGAIALGGACSQETRDDAKETAVSAGRDVEHAAQVAHDNVEDAADTMAETYDEKREEGEGRIEAAGDSYNAVLDKAE